MNANDSEPTEPIENPDNRADQHAGEPGVLPPQTDEAGDHVQAPRSLAELLGEPEPLPLPHDVQWFTATLLQDPGKAVQTAPVIAMVAELLDILRDEHTSDQQAHHALRRAVRWLHIFSVEPARTANRPDQNTGRRDYAISAKDLAAAASSRQLATTWLRGTPQAAIRTAPVVGVVAQLLDNLRSSTSNRDAQARLRHAVRLLDVFTDQDGPTAPHHR
jgi:hypothetical protein